MARAQTAVPFDAEFPQPSSPEAEETQMIALATKRVRQRIVEGTASSQELCHYLKLGSERERSENEKLREEIKLLKARTAEIESAQKIEQLYADAIRSFKEYRGDEDDPEDIQ